jgi:hypothetical protein
MENTFRISTLCWVNFIFFSSGLSNMRIRFPKDCFIDYLCLKTLFDLQVKYRNKVIQLHQNFSQEARSNIPNVLPVNGGRMVISVKQRLSSS